MNVPKIVVVVTWLWAVLSLLAGGDSGLVTIGYWTFWILLGVHAIECAIFLPKLKAAGGSLPAHLAQTLVFGILHANALAPRAEEE